VRLFGYSIPLIFILAFRVHSRREKSGLAFAHSGSQPHLIVSQSNLQVVAILFAFVFYTTLKGHLRNYLVVLGVR
jgi:hypothetical protein